MADRASVSITIAGIVPATLLDRAHFEAAGFTIPALAAAPDQPEAINR